MGCWVALELSATGNKMLNLTFSATLYLQEATEAAKAKSAEHGVSLVVNHRHRFGLRLAANAEQFLDWFVV